MVRNMADIGEQTSDPFAAFEVVAGTTRDPYPDFARQRAEEPVMRGTLMDLSHFPPEFLPEEQWSVFRYEDVSRVFRETKSFNSAGHNDTVGLIFGENILGMDGPAHRAHRSLVANAFKEKSLRRWEPEVIAPVCHQLLDEIADDGSADLVLALTYEFPTRVIASILGLPVEDMEMFRDLSIRLIGIGGGMEAGFAASMELSDYFQGLIDQRRSEPAEDVISDLVTAEVDGERLTDEAICSFLKLLLPAGIETTFRSSGNLLFLLLTHQDQFEQVRQHRELVSRAIEEGLRYETPLTTVARFAACDLEFGGHMIRKGATVSPVIGSANRDESRWDDPESFNIHRNPQPHIAFAAGPHMCLGMHLARIETEVMLHVLMDRFEDIELDPGDRDPHIRGMAFRSPTSLPVTFRPVG
jgi:cytochrome P450